MSLVKLIETFTHKMECYDVPLLKVTVFFATLFLITAWPAFSRFVLEIEWYWYLALTVICLFFLMKKMFGKQS